MGVMVGIGVAVGPDVGAGLSLQPLRTTETVRTVTNASQRILSAYPLTSVVYPSYQSVVDWQVSFTSMPASTCFFTSSTSE